ncbi:hypothetical protein HOD29_00215 [archaeon]|jgi:hypothetical protein|nr:hypothetical protein [archaeon]
MTKIDKNKIKEGFDEFAKLKLKNLEKALIEGDSGDIFSEQIKYQQFKEYYDIHLSSEEGSIFPEEIEQKYARILEEHYNSRNKA